MFTTNELDELAEKYVECIKDEKLIIPDQLRKGFLELLATDTPVKRFAVLDKLRNNFSLKDEI